jgi:pimeloyl-ACP methyl ester carboxylesterase
MKESIWNGFKRVDFTFEGMDAIIVFPDNSNKTDNIDKIPLLAEHDIPVLLIYGEDDDIVPFRENGKCLVDYYTAHGKTIEVIGKKNCGHHPHGLNDVTPIIEFMLKYKS